MVTDRRETEYSHPIVKLMIRRALHATPDFRDSREVEYTGGTLSAYRRGKASIEELGHLNAARLYETNFGMAGFASVRVPV